MTDQRFHTGRGTKSNAWMKRICKRKEAMMNLLTKPQWYQPPKWISHHKLRLFVRLIINVNVGMGYVNLSFK